ncbi:MAG: hypothetical protein AABY22_17820 [Nanoarchaeota archaeon]
MIFEIPLKKNMEVKMEQQKIRIEFKLSKNFNSATLGVEDHPIVFEGEQQQRDEIRKICKLLREEVEHQLSLIGTNKV